MMTPTNSEIDRIIGTFIALKFDVDTDDFSDGTLERWNNMKAELEALINKQIIEARDKLLQTMEAKLLDNSIALENEETAVLWYVVQETIAELRTTK